MNLSISAKNERDAEKIRALHQKWGMGKLVDLTRHKLCYAYIYDITPDKLNLIAEELAQMEMTEMEVSHA
ncbi:MAG: hypothetical protein ABEL51_15730 [Salinibacter sp.]